MFMRHMGWWFGLVLGFTSVQAQDAVGVDEHEELDSIVVTGTRISAGGAQDIGHFRMVAEDGEMPRPESLTVEGLLSEHDLLLPLTRPCTQLLCLATETLPQGLPSRPDDRLFVGLGFTSNVDAATWQREPLNLIAVVDQSGSMDGEPLALVRQALAEIAGQMRTGDRLAIVLYGDAAHVHMPSRQLPQEAETVRDAIAAIESSGSTNMEDGLQLGFATARAAASTFPGNTRVMLFTDEQPNVGSTDAESFMGLATAASRDGIGLTTVGVGVQYDGTLARRIGSVRGGNLFFVADNESVQKLFRTELDTMVSEIAHDIRITLKPVPGYRVSGVFGVPDGLLEQGRDGETTIVVPTAFFSTQAGGIFLSLSKDEQRRFLPPARLRPGETLLDLRLAYVAAADGESSRDRLDVTAPATGAAPSEALRTAFALVDQFLVLRQASESYHRDGKPKLAFRQLSALLGRLQATGLAVLEPERKLVKAMTEKAALMSGYAGEVSAELIGGSLDGSWRITRVVGAGLEVAVGDRCHLEDGELCAVDAQDEELCEDFRFDGRVIDFPESNLRFAVRQTGERMVLRAPQHGTRIELVRTEE